MNVIIFNIKWSTDFVVLDGSHYDCQHQMDQITIINRVLLGRRTQFETKKRREVIGLPPPIRGKTRETLFSGRLESKIIFVICSSNFTLFSLFYKKKPFYKWPPPNQCPPTHRDAEPKSYMGSIFKM